MASSIKGQHILCTTESGEIIQNDNNVAVWDTKSKTMFFLPLDTKVYEFFNLSLEDTKILEKENTNNLEEIETIATSFHTMKETSKTSIIQKNSCIEGIASWKDDNAVKMLIYLWKEHESKFKSSKFRKDTVWKEISEKLWKANNNWRYSATQCENKWKDLRKTYVKVKDHNNTSGNSTKTCKFFDDINDILSDKPRITPISVASNLRKRPLSINSTVNSVNCSSDSENYDLLCDTDLDVEEQTKITKKPRRQKDFDELKTVLQSTAKEREEARERRHQEMLNQSEKAINTMKDVMLKLIEKF